MTAKAKTKKETTTTTEAPLFDAKATQRIGLTIGGDHQVIHEMAPLTDERFFKLADALEEADGDPSGILTLKDALWEEHCSSVTGYKERPDWRKGVPTSHRIAAAEAFRGVIVMGIGDGIADGVFDVDAPIRVDLVAVFSEFEVKPSISFRQPTKADVEEYLAIANGEPDKNALASATKNNSPSERLYRLGKKLTVEHSGYTGQPPASHVNAAATMMILSQMTSAKKFMA